MTKLIFKMERKFLRQLYGFDVLFNKMPYKSFMTQNSKGKRKSSPCSCEPPEWNVATPWPHVHPRVAFEV